SHDRPSSSKARARRATARAARFARTATVARPAARFGPPGSLAIRRAPGPIGRASEVGEGTRDGAASLAARAAVAGQAASGGDVIRGPRATRRARRREAPRVTAASAKAGDLRVLD